MKKTKKNYEMMLNEMHSSVCETSFMILGKKYHGEYGTLLRKHDPLAFHLGYKAWAKFN